MHSKEEYLLHVIPYRMKAIEVFRLALGWVTLFERPRQMKVYFDDELFATGLSTAWTNPVIEAGIMHSRACLEFLGLKEDGKSPFKLVERKSKRFDDYGIEDYDLPKLTVAEAVDSYEGPADQAERALASVIHCANKGVGHMTAGQLVVAEDLHLYEIASRGIPSLLINRLYARLSLPAPDYKLTSRARSAR